VFDFDYYDGTETDNNKTISDQNVYEYEFINQGNSICLINGMKLYPPHANIKPDRIKLDIRANEKDVQVYKYSFLPVDFQVCLYKVPNENNTCSEMIVGKNDFICGNLGNPICLTPFPETGCIAPDCIFTLTFYLDGVQVNTPIDISCAQTLEEIELLLMGAMTLEPFNKQNVDVQVTYVGTSLCFTFEGFIISGAGLLTFTVSVNGFGCIAPPPEEIALTCKLDSINSLLVISKLPAKRI